MLYFRIIIISSLALVLKTSTEAEFLMSFERLFQYFILEALKGKARCAAEVRHWGWLSWLLCPVQYEWVSERFISFINFNVSFTLNSDTVQRKEKKLH